ncbi:MAG: efflux RND transporter periplasmic adaptor subunit [Anaerolineales bacterium]|jgi:HlyD family secretion protein
MKKWIILGVIAVVLVGGYFVVRQFRDNQQSAAASEYQTVRAERGNLTATVGATGVVRANQSALLTWQTSGSVEQVMVDVGEVVDADEILASLEKTSLPQNVILAQADLVNAQNTLEDLYDTELALAQAEQNLANAQKAVEDAQRYVDNINADAPQADVDQARANVVLAKDELDKARKAFRPYENKAEDNVNRATLQNKLAEAQQRYDAAVSRLNNLLGTVSDTTMEIAQSNLEVAKAQLEDAQKRYDDLKAGPDPVDVTNAQTRIDAAQATLKMVNIQAPFSGKITNVEVKPGDLVSPGTPAFRIDDLSHLLVDVQVSEVDINRIQPGQDVSLTFDAILGKEYNGIVKEVALVGNSNQGVVDFTVTVELTDGDEDVRPGMTAAVNIVVRQLEDVLLVPNRAVRVREGERVVYILQGGNLTPIPITLGASSDTSSEVVDGDLKTGDVIVLNPPIVFDQSGPPPFVQR